MDSAFSSFVYSLDGSLSGTDVQDNLVLGGDGDKIGSQLKIIEQSRGKLEKTELQLKLEALVPQALQHGVNMDALFLYSKLEAAFSHLASRLGQKSAARSLLDKLLQTATSHEER